VPFCTSVTQNKRQCSAGQPWPASETVQNRGISKTHTKTHYAF